MSHVGSKYEKYRKNDIYPHKHCNVCKKLIPEEENPYGDYCSPECKGIPIEKKKKNKKRIFYLVGGYVIVFGVLIGLTIFFNNR